ncbi:methyltransferase domain-containing protein [Anabaena catenula]|uniref:Methyltransferase domain-containing protein n=1 Tax=Anabaena catenula FACHB-362 TaxID=2692877 RepID=A0ABR8J0V1_9NOST|nr:methyltransferase domain-containing protein [Anabaena catenula]MBD2691069.1 methyltransferase domain-containing protein [Anabaena catenula FACHB-362]
MKLSNLNEYLSSNNPWANRLIGIETFSRKRDLEQVEQEYNQDKYGKLLNFDFADIQLYKNKELELAGLIEKNDIFISMGEEIVKINFSLACSIFYSLISTTLKRYAPKRICELGCGYGYNLSYLKNICPEVYGGEYSENAVKIASFLKFDIKKFNYYNLEEYSCLIRHGSAILTVHSVEQLPNAECFINGLHRNRQNIDVIVNFEPSFLKTRKSLIGTLRNRYIEINDYNRDLITLLMDRNDVEILEYYPDYIGINPLNSTNIVIWRFK